MAKLSDMEFHRERYLASFDRRDDASSGRCDGATTEFVGADE
jgi:hypothetical protein